ncbi:MAG: CopD family protein [Sphingorhabdus sp.]|uniref:CopD family protein n=1 Tax=Sphingorhabdus sp. TaxID=1902408 RepID=UPI0038FCE647
MTEIIAMLYFWLKSAHIIFVIFWMAGLFMIPRFFVYHQESAEGSDESTKWVDRETKLIRIILNPSIIIVWVVGLLLAWHIGAMADAWFHAKLLFVLGLSAYHGWMVSYAKKLAQGERTLTGKQLRLLNEVPGVTAAVIVILVVAKPF